MSQLLKRADHAIRESRLIRDLAHKDLVNARVAVARIRAAVQLAHIETERAASLCRETASHSLSARDRSV